MSTWLKAGGKDTALEPGDGWWPLRWSGMRRGGRATGSLLGHTLQEHGTLARVEEKMKLFYSFDSWET